MVSISALYQLKKNLDNEAIAIVDVFKYSEDQLYSVLGNYVITKEKVELHISRSFDLDDLHVSHSQVQENYCVRFSKRLIEYNPNDVSELLTFDRNEMKVINNAGCGTYYCVTFAREIEAYVIDYMSYQQCVNNLKTKMEEFSLDTTSIDLDYVIDALERKDISIRNASKEDIITAISTISTAPIHGDFDELEGIFSCKNNKSPLPSLKNLLRKWGSIIPEETPDEITCGLVKQLSQDEDLPELESCN